MISEEVDQRSFVGKKRRKTLSRNFLKSRVGWSKDSRLINLGESVGEPCFGNGCYQSRIILEPSEPFNKVLRPRRALAPPRLRFGCLGSGQTEA